MTIDLFQTKPAGLDRPVVFAGLKRLWASYKRHRAQRRTIIELSRLDAYLLRDIGIEPLDIYDALNGKRGQSILLSPMRRLRDDPTRSEHE